MSVEPIAPPRLALALVELTDCVCEQLATTGAGPTCWCGLYPGATVSWEYCGECASDQCGMGWVRLGTIFPYGSYPSPTLQPNCAAPLAAAIEVGALRCVPQPASGELLEATAMIEVGLRQQADAHALYLAMACCGIKDLTPERYTPLGPQGGCVGGLWTAYIPID